MEIVKYITLYATEAIVIALVGVTLIAGLYQLIRDGLQRKTQVGAPAAQTVKKS